MTENVNDTVSDEVIKNVQKRNIYFAHKSVGFNIIDGIKDITDKINIQSIVDNPQISESIFLHSQIGENYKPLLKLEDFSKRINSEVLNSIDTAFLKFCYVDVDETTDIDVLFGTYTETYAILEERNPKIMFIHMTIPLMSQQKGLKSFIKKLIGRKVNGYEDNVRRQEFNSKIRENYPLIFDIAEIESTKPDGSRMIHSLNGIEYYSMYSGYTNDGGHLNETGRKKVAKELLEFLSKL